MITKQGRKATYDQELLKRVMKERRCSRVWAYELLRRAENNGEVVAAPDEVGMKHLAQGTRTHAPGCVSDDALTRSEARVALTAARAALLADPGNEELKRAVKEAEEVKARVMRGG